MTIPDQDVFHHGERYERYVGRWSRVAAPIFLAWLAAPPGGRWLDAGCGTGALTEAILAMAAPAEVLGVDPSEGFLTLAREHVTDDRARFVAGDARALPVPDGKRDAVVGGLMLNFVPGPAIAVAEMARVVRPGGVVGAYVWDYAEGMQMQRLFWDMATALDPAAAERDEGKRFDSICSPKALTGLWEGAGLGSVETRAIDVPMAFRDFDDYWTPFLGGQGPGPAYVAGLDEERQVALRERLRESLPIAADGSISLTSRAWAVRGVR